MSYCPNEARIKQLRDIVTHWQTWLSRLSADERMRIEAQQPGFLDDLDKQLARYVEIATQASSRSSLLTLYPSADESTETLESDYYASRTSSWGVYNPMGELGMKFLRTESELRQRDAEFWVSALVSLISRGHTF